MTSDTGAQQETRLHDHVVVVGGANTDIAGMSSVPLVARDSNPGRVEVSAGGVGRNIAENLARLGVEVDLITAFGDDHNSRALAASCRTAGIGIEGSLVTAEVPGAVYLSILDDGGDMALALSDMRPLDDITPAALEARSGLFGTADVVIADTNIPADALEWLVGHVEAPVLLDAVSVAKATRAMSALSRLHTLKASALEAGVLLGWEVRNRDHAEEAARALVSLGVGRVFVTSGAFGSAWADATGSGHVRAPVVEEVRNATGAGDAFAAGVGYATLRSWDPARAAAFGSACAALALESESTVSTRLDFDAAVERMRAVV